MKPQQLLYAPTGTPPAATVVILAAQHAMLILMLAVYPLVAAQQLELSIEATQALVTASIAAAALGTLVQCRGGRWGSGLLATHVPSPIFLPLFIELGHAGGVGLAAGMLLVAGAVQMLLARALPRLRVLFPVEICGLVITMLGVSMIQPALTRAFGLRFGDGGMHGGACLVALITFGLIVVLTVWSPGRLRFYAVLIGCVAGYLLVAASGFGGPAAQQTLRAAPIIGFPSLTVPAWEFDIRYLPPVIMVAIVSSLDTLGGILTLDRMGDAAWRRPNLARVSGGLLADGIGNAVSGAIGAMGTGVSSANIGLVFATGVAARRIGLVAGVLMLASLFFPKLVALLSAMPDPVVGALLVYAALFLIVSGASLMMSRMMNERRTFMIGTAFVAGLSVLLMPGVYRNLPHWVQPLFASPLTLGGGVAILLNLLFRLGIAQRATLRVCPGASVGEAVSAFFERQGSTWGGRQEVFQRATWAVNEACELVGGLGNPPLDIEITAVFDELNLVTELTYAGRLPCPADAGVPSADELLDRADATARLSMHLLREYTTKMQMMERAGQTILRLEFEH